MIETKVMYQIKCDRCGAIYRCGSQQFFVSEESAIMEAAEDGWFVDGKVRCPKCCELDEYGENDKLKPLLPYCVWKVERFLKSIAYGVHSTIDGENFVITFSLIQIKQKDNIKNMIDEILDEKQLSGGMTHSVEICESGKNSQLFRGKVTIIVRQFDVDDDVRVVRCKKNPELIGKTGKVIHARSVIDEYFIASDECDDVDKIAFSGEDLEKIKD